MQWGGSKNSMEKKKWLLGRPANYKTFLFERKVNLAQDESSTEDK
jgi:hypothetical protein